MNILVIGSGGREHALVWKINQSSKVEKVYVAPGNAGTYAIAENVDIKADDLEGLLAFAKKKSIDLTVVGPEVPLSLGIVVKNDFNVSINDKSIEMEISEVEKLWREALSCKMAQQKIN